MRQTFPLPVFWRFRRRFFCRFVVDAAFNVVLLFGTAAVAVVVVDYVIVDIVVVVVVANIVGVVFVVVVIFVVILIAGICNRNFCVLYRLILILCSLCHLAKQQYLNQCHQHR